MEAECLSCFCRTSFVADQYSYPCTWTAAIDPKVFPRWKKILKTLTAVIVEIIYIYPVWGSQEKQIERTDSRLPLLNSLTARRADSAEYLRSARLATSLLTFSSFHSSTSGSSVVDNWNTLWFLVTFQNEPEPYTIDESNILCNLFYPSKKGSSFSPSTSSICWGRDGWMRLINGVRTLTWTPLIDFLSSRVIGRFLSALNKDFTPFSSRQLPRSTDWALCTPRIRPLELPVKMNFFAAS